MPCKFALPGRSIVGATLVILVADNYIVVERESGESHIVTVNKGNTSLTTSHHGQVRYQTYLTNAP
jgi:hypothetical protein